MTIKDTEERAAAVSKGFPRVSLADIEKRIVSKHSFNMGEMIYDATASDVPPDHPLRLLTCCFLTMDNGFTVVGKSAPASPENFNQDYGHELAYEDCIRQLWPLMGFELRSKLMNEAQPSAPPAPDHVGLADDPGF